MGRTLKRVPLDFDWPLNKTWKGYLNPMYEHKIECQKCNGDGLTIEARLLNKLWYNDLYDMELIPLITDNTDLIDFAHSKRNWRDNVDEDDIAALIAADRLWDFTRRPHTKEQATELEELDRYWMEQTNGYVPTPDEVNEWNKTGIGHDNINRHYIIKAKLKKLGCEEYCPECDGEGYTFPNEATKMMAEMWKPYEPPTGEGYQLWETTTEGSPISPIFETLSKLCEWCSKNTTTFGKHTATKEEWYEMLSEDRVHHKSGQIIFI